MASIIQKRVCAEIEGPFVLFMIGARINRPWKLNVVAPFLASMPRMLKELAAKPELGLLHARQHFGPTSATLIQYWRSFEHLEAYARSADHAHLPVWRWFNSQLGSNGDIGIWHETYLIQPGAYESIYNNMPPFGLGAAGTLVDAVGARQEARQRIKAAADTAVA
ncbi:MAG TPA: DUF4188 domain-containing protein [Caulobacteraceae bacterium]|nr:DUF4188 domain-containing protein [Caulobacteraceae bacterium]